MIFQSNKLTDRSIYITLIRSISLSIKDSLRGVRLIVRSLRNRAANLLDFSPRPVKLLGTVVVDRFDRIADRVNRNSSRIAHRYLDPKVSRKADVAVLSRLLVLDDANASVIFAKISYDNMKYAVPYLCNRFDSGSNFFISEMLGAVAYGKVAGSFKSEKPEAEKAAVLMQSLLQIGMLRTSKSANAANAQQRTTRQIACMSAFAIVLWLIIERELTPESEEELLMDCCDLSLAQSEAIETALGTDASAGSLAALVELVEFSKRSV